MQKCPVCGNELPETETSCPLCGTNIGDGGTPEANSPMASNPSPPPPSPTPPPPPPASAPLARLLFKSAGMLTGQEFPLGGRVVVGRFHPETGPVDIDLSGLPQADYVSRRHAEIYPDPSGQWLVRDLHSTNGTFVLPAGGDQFQRVSPDQPVPIRDGDEVVFGNARFVFKTQGGGGS